MGLTDAPEQRHPPPGHSMIDHRIAAVNHQTLIHYFRNTYSIIQNLVYVCKETSMQLITCDSSELYAIFIYALRLITTAKSNYSHIDLVSAQTASKQLGMLCACAKARILFKKNKKDFDLFRGVVAI